MYVSHANCFRVALVQLLHAHCPLLRHLALGQKSNLAACFNSIPCNDHEQWNRCCARCNTYPQYGSGGCSFRHTHRQRKLKQVRTAADGGGVLTLIDGRNATPVHVVDGRGTSSSGMQQSSPRAWTCLSVPLCKLHVVAAPRSYLCSRWPDPLQLTLVMFFCHQLAHVVYLFQRWSSPAAWAGGVFLHTYVLPHLLMCNNE